MNNSNGYVLDKTTEIKYFLHLGNAYFSIKNIETNKCFHYWIEKVNGYYKLYIKLYNPTTKHYRYENVAYYTLFNDKIGTFKYTNSPFKSCTESVVFEKILTLALNRKFPPILEIKLEDRCLVTGTELRSKKAKQMRVQTKEYDNLPSKIQTMLITNKLF